MTIDQTIAYGLHSHIPVCCVVFFVTEWGRENRDDSPYARAVHRAPVQYVPCPDCLAYGRFVALKVCAESCGRECAPDYQRADGSLPDEMTRKVVDTVKAHMRMGYFQ